MADFNADHKVEQGKFFSEGVHTVKITGVDIGTNDNDKEYIEFTVEGQDGETGNARMWFTTDNAIKFTFNTIRSIFVHNAQKGKEQEARDMVNKVKNSDELATLCDKVLIGKEAFYVVERSDYTYTNAAGEKKQGYNRNLFGWKPEPKKTTVEDLMSANEKPMTGDEVPDVF